VDVDVVSDRRHPAAASKLNTTSALRFRIIARSPDDPQSHDDCRWPNPKALVAPLQALIFDFRRSIANSPELDPCLPAR
jgi:hypothetical protein